VEQAQCSSCSKTTRISAVAEKPRDVPCYLDTFLRARRKLAHESGNCQVTNAYNVFITSYFKTLIFCLWNRENRKFCRCAAVRKNNQKATR